MAGIDLFFFLLLLATLEANIDEEPFAVNKKLFLMATVLSVLVFLCSPVTASPNASKPNISQINPEGGYAVFVYKNDQWHAAGNLNFDKHLREKSIDLSPLASTTEKIRVRLVQKGGGAAHIDAVGFGNLAPIDIKGSDDSLALLKLSKKDFDVIDAFKTTLTLTFSNELFPEDKTLSVTARVEPADITKAPFKFPQANLFKPVNNDAKFYTYELGRQSDEKRVSGTPFFKEYCRTGSGHPSGFTYGWVHHDAENLYVKIDFTPDNTRDGDKDYARLYVKTPAGVKNFKISESQTQWGRPNFTYTNTASYQHKTYDFKIPFEELGLEKTSTADGLLLAFSAYGTAAPAAWDRVSAGPNTTVAIGTNGSIWSAGENSIGQLGVGNPSSPIDHLVPEANGDTDWYKVSNGVNHTLAIKNDGSLWAWGWDAFNQLGDDDLRTDQDAPVPLATGGTWDGTWEAVAGGYGHSVGLRSDGTIWSWGLNDNGQLGIDAVDDSTTPVALLDPADMGSMIWTAVAAGDYHTVALRSDGTLWAWGDNSSGQLGDGTNNDSLVPVRVSDPADMAGKTWTAVSVAGYVTVALRSDNTIWSWGNNQLGQLGNNSTAPSAIPVQEANAWTDWVAVNTGGNHTVAMRSDGTLWAWGNGLFGQLGNGSNFISLIPFAVAGGDTDWVEFDAGGNHTAAIKADGTLYTWGVNEVGQLADFTNFDINVPHRVGAPAAISGYVKNTLGSGIPDVNLQAYNETLNKNYSAITNASGYYEFTEIPWGCYDLDIDAYPLPTPNDDKEFYLGPAEEKLLDDYIIKSGSFTLSGETPFGGNDLAEVLVFSNILNIHHYDTTDVNGYYEIPNLPAGEYVLRVFHTQTGYAQYGQKVILTGNLTQNIALAVEACVRGRVVDHNGQPVTNAWVGVENDLYNIEFESGVDGNGEFNLCGFPEGLAVYDIEPDFVTGLCASDRRLFFIAGGVTTELGDIALQKCAPVQGQVVKNVPEEFCQLSVESEGLSFSADYRLQDDGSYELWIPEGTYKIFLDADNDGPWEAAAFPIEVTVDAASAANSTPVAAPDMELITASHPDAAQISGSVVKTNSLDPDPQGAMLVGLLPAGLLDNVTPEKLSNTGGIQERWLQSFSEYGADTIPYDLYPVPPGPYDAFLIVRNDTTAGLESITLLGLNKNVIIDPAEAETGVNFSYQYSGLNQISGEVRDDVGVPGRPVVGAMVMLVNAAGDLVAFTRTDEEGAYSIYNPPAGTFAVKASHPDYSGNPDSNITIPDDSSVDPLILGYEASSAVPGLDIVYDGIGVYTWTSNASAPATALGHWVKVVDHDGISSDGSSHTVTVTYPGGETYSLWFVNQEDSTSAYYEFWDNTIDQPIDPGVYSGAYVYRITDPDGDWSEVADDLNVDTVGPLDETTFSPAFNTPHSITAFFDDIIVNGSPYDNFSDGFLDEIWQSQPPEATYIGGEVRMQNTWFPESRSVYMNLLNPETVDSLQVTVRVTDATSSDEFLYARLAGQYCKDSSGREIFARIGINGSQAYYTVYSEYWDGNHLIEVPLVSSNSLGPVTMGNRYELTLDWDESTATFSFQVRGLDDAIDYSPAPVTVPGPISAPSNHQRGISISAWVLEDTTTPTFDWALVSGATQYRVRIYGWNGERIFQGYTTAPPYTIPPGILKPWGLYKYRIYALKDHQWFEWDNVAGSNQDKTPIIIDTGTEALDPHIDLNSMGVYTWTYPSEYPYGDYTHFEAYIHDAQGVPENIESVIVTLPAGLGDVKMYLDEKESNTQGLYRGVYFGAPQSGTYRFTVTDRDGNSVWVEEDITSDPIDSPPLNSLIPADNTVINSTGFDIDWADVPGAAFYQINLYDKDSKFLGNIKTTESQFRMPDGLLPEQSLFRYRIYTRREYFEDNVDNSTSMPPFNIWNAKSFFTTPTNGTAPPSINIDTFGVAVWQAPHPETGAATYWLEFGIQVDDADGVPENIELVEVTYPDGTTKRLLKYDDSPEWGFNYYNFEIFTDESLIQDAGNSTGVYSFRVRDFDGNELTLEDTLPEVSDSVINWPTNVLPSDGAKLFTATPTISWDPVPNATYYKVRIMSAWSYPTVHCSPELTDMQYTIPDGELLEGYTYSIKVYAYREGTGNEIDFYATNTSWHIAAPRFTIESSTGFGDGSACNDDSECASDNCVNLDGTLVSDICRCLLHRW